MLIDWEVGHAFDDNDNVVPIPAEWRRGVRDKTTRQQVDVLRYDTVTHLLARPAKNRNGNIVGGPPITEERELEPIPPMTNSSGLRPGNMTPFRNVGNTISGVSDIRRILGRRGL